jgi:hypothetical protein
MNGLSSGKLKAYSLITLALSDVNSVAEKNHIFEYNTTAAYLRICGYIFNRLIAILRIWDIRRVGIVFVVILLMQIKPAALVYSSPAERW